MSQATLNYIEYATIPGSSRLFLDYIAGRDKILRFYAVNPFDEEMRGWPSGSPSMRADRAKFLEMLMEQNRRFGCSEKTVRNIERLRDKDVRAVVTGQQVGIAGGPLYTVYKAITAVQLARGLEERGMPAVPVFWMETNDHDFEEIRTAGILGKANNAARVAYEDENIPEGTPVGSIALSAAIGDFMEKLREELQETEFTREIFTLLNEAYRPGATFGEAFGVLITRLFSEYGLVLFDPSDPRTGELAKDFYGRVIENREQITEKAQAVSRELEQAGYHAQVRVPDDSAHLFCVKDGKRSLVRFGAQPMIGESESSEAELADIIKTAPASLSPTVLTRPLLQDYLFPTAAYIAGPAEIAYWAQVRPLYGVLGMSMPAVYPRAGGTLVETRILRLVEKHNLSFDDIFAAPGEVVKNLVRGAAPEEGEQAFDAFLADVEKHALHVRSVAGSVEETLAGAVDTMKEKIVYQVGRVRQKYEKALQNKYATITGQAERIVTFFHPAEKLQERELCVTYFLTRHGLELIPRLIERVPLDSRKHFVIEI